jgi:hypothetical protein
MKQRQAKMLPFLTASLSDLPMGLLSDLKVEARLLAARQRKHWPGDLKFGYLFSMELSTLIDVRLIDFNNLPETLDLAIERLVDISLTVQKLC